MVTIKTAGELARMRRAGEIVAEALATMKALVRPGVTTKELDAAAEAVIRKQGGIPSFKGYHGFPAAICASVNEEIVHGIPGARVLQEGEIISLDVGVIWEGYQGDAAVTVAVGQISPEARRLMDATKAALAAAIEAARDGARLGDVSHAVESTAAEWGYDVVRQYGGHGIGKEMHEAPHVPNWGPAGRGLRLRAGMTMALEPMLTSDGSQTRTLEDGWTVVTANGDLSAHYEHTIAVTENGGMVLTRLADGAKPE
ncbi:MAG: type I methionyl aminopeptidase [Anaerolineae bacterium]|nr:type I methionyl aminopeptidase [Anaerolineae bacterium]